MTSIQFRKELDVAFYMIAQIEAIFSSAERKRSNVAFYMKTKDVKEYLAK